MQWAENSEDMLCSTVQFKPFPVKCQGHSSVTDVDFDNVRSIAAPTALNLRQTLLDPKFI
jgi:hypothetical protein